MDPKWFIQMYINKYFMPFYFYFFKSIMIVKHKPNHSSQCPNGGQS